MFSNFLPHSNISTAVSSDDFPGGYGDSKQKEM